MNSVWAVECHDVYDYDDICYIQRWVRLIAPCPVCHECKHNSNQFLSGVHNAIEQLCYNQLTAS
jgi:hypothetical protein